MSLLLPLLALGACTSGYDSASDLSAASDTAAETDAACFVVDGRPAGWGEATHGNAADPDYDGVFDRTRVQRVDIVLAAEDYTAAYAELETILGTPFGEGGGPPDGGPPDDGGGDGGPPDGGPPDRDGGGLDLTDGDPSYVAATVQVDGTTWCAVGFRFKGNSSLAGAWSQGVGKLPFRLDFDHYEDDHPETKNQRFHGFKEITFGNGFGDATLVRDVLASELLEARGVPAARNALWEVYVDVGEGPVYFGLYTASEDPSDAFADRVWGDDDGNLYKPDGDCADLTCFDEASFEKKSNEDAADYADVQALLAALATDRTDAAAWRTGLEAVLDVDGFLRWLAMNTAMENWDTYGAMAHNYYLYAVPADGGRFAWIPWDHNLSLMDGFQGSTDPLLADVGEEWPLIRYVLDDAVYAERYRGYLAESLDGAYATEAFEARAEALRALVADAVGREQAGYTFVPGADAWADAFDGSDGLYAHAEDRRAAVLDALAE